MSDLNTNVTDSSALTENAIVNLLPLPSTGKVLGNSFGGLINDANRNAIPVGNTFQTRDAASTAVLSPATVGAAETILTVPARAISIHLYATTNDTRISNDPNLTDYFVLKAGQSIDLDCAREDYIYLLRDASSNATVQFIFKVV